MSQPPPSLSASPASSASDPNAPRRSVRILRRTIAITIVVAFSLAAIGGIIVLLGDIESEATFKVIGTTALTGAVSVAAFCGATLIGRRTQWFGIATIGMSAVTMALSLWFIWGDPFADPEDYELGEVLFQALSSLVLVTAVASISALILLLAPRSWLVRIGLPITLGLLTLGTSLVLVTIWVESAWELEWLTRLNGIVWILAALGVVIVPLTSLLLRAGTKPTEAAPAAAVTNTITGAHAGTSTGSAQTHPTQHGSTPPSPTLSPAMLERVDAAARAEGITADELIDRLLSAEHRTP
ncbi:hypothetical protein D3I60_00740 [Brevibacterium permense]|uniref:hypothetical protein n=1 Tax=Brevibacterium permense TaxID=234834 RepID=UPI0021D13538|nr:hypothetical protein [Brevibacterium permense]MCU4295622.1 hypothetical protein [Brevibacterium permense]